ncbi:hypothetical protein [Staphylococcus delphini]|uniref:hypothetical protein n=1 Tax=Staphylococcus delphini TaxID=53344 RepID=UPI0021CE5F64|nr:hypothetical protein [Staphylococcus delphini]UXS36509.1 hypothetical protein MUA34_10825 [Staphylococcus delphini]UXS43988.1 hypothetical protein MUA39_11615 [Staphylococcus delphini]UXV44612.1 hypothetical protein MUA63_11230 [Staphylococcus delphini]
MIVLYILGFLIVMWIGQIVSQRLVARQYRLWVYLWIWMVGILIIQCMLIYGFVGELAQHTSEILSLFYDDK